MKFATFNLQNFFLDQLHPEKKELDKIQKISEIILQISADVMLVCEADNHDQMNLFCESHLKNSYQALITDSNSDRGIHVGFLVKKSEQLDFKLFSNKEYPISDNCQDNYFRFFSRDLAELHVSKNNIVEWIVFNTHLKSMRTENPIDPKGNKKRLLELEAISKIVQIRKAQYPNAKIIIGGDFNDSMIKPIFGNDYNSIGLKKSHIDILEHLQIPANERSTFVYFSIKERSLIQLDYLLFPRDLIDLIKKKESGIFIHTSPTFKNTLYPLTLMDKNDLASDHYPIYVTFAER